MKRRVISQIFRKALLCSVAIACIYSAAFSQQCETAFDFTEWSLEGTADGDWQVAGPNDVVNTSYILPATFFVNKQKLINVFIKGTMSVETGSDDDFVGIVFGYQNPKTLADDNQYQFYLFGWKGGTGSLNGYQAKEGFRLSLYNGFINMADQEKYFWGQVEKSPQRRLFDKKYGDTLGWVNSREYLFELFYSSNRIRISIDGKMIFEREGCFPAGKFGFYCMSQTLTRFMDFTYRSFIDFVPQPTSVCPGEKIYFNAFDLNCSVLPDFIESMNWDFGDGQSASVINPEHTYSEAGEYRVELIVDKTGGCSDTIIKTVTVKPKPTVDIGDDTLVPACSSITFDAGNPGSSYAWSGGQVSQATELAVGNTDTLVWVVVDKNGCLAGDTLAVQVEGNDLHPNG
ncbi:MAG: PKD domain-containing protein [Bacteroidales bacterium]|nr:PKD domain-containing protein [Bacteroidales bacterium]